MPLVAAYITNYFQNMMSFCRISHSYFRRRDPIIAALINCLNSIYVLLSSGKQLKILKYQVHLTYFRMQQMEKLMHENNPNNSKGGSNLNSYR